MSVQALSWVFEQSESIGAPRLVLLSIANHASHDGDCAWPSVETIAKETRLSERAVQYAFAMLEKLKELQITRGGGRGNTHMFTLPKYIEWVQTLHRFKTQRVQTMNERVQTETLKGATGAPEPSLEPSLLQPSNLGGIAPEFIQAKERDRIAKEKREEKAARKGKRSYPAKKDFRHVESEPKRSRGEEARARRAEAIENLRRRWTSPGSVR